MPHKQSDTSQHLFAQFWCCIAGAVVPDGRQQEHCILVHVIVVGVQQVISTMSKIHLD